MSMLAVMSNCQCGNDGRARFSTLTHDRRVTNNVRARYRVRAGTFPESQLRIHCVRENQTVGGTMPKQAKEFFEYDSVGYWESAGALPGPCRDLARLRA